MPHVFVPASISFLRYLFCMIFAFSSPFEETGKSIYERDFVLENFHTFLYFGRIFLFFI